MTDEASDAERRRAIEVLDEIACGLIDAAARLEKYGEPAAGAAADMIARSARELGCACCQRVDNPGHPAGPWRYYQTRFWARVELLPWDPQHEIDERRLVRPDDFLRTLSWGSAPSAAIILEEGLKIEARRKGG